MLAQPPILGETSSCCRLGPHAAVHCQAENGLKAFNTALKASAFDLMSWRRKANLSARDTAILDADDGSGWELAEALLRPREIEVDEESGSVKFVNSNHEAIRLGVGLALTHKFLKQVWRCHLACCW